MGVDVGEDSGNIFYFYDQRPCKSIVFPCLDYRVLFILASRKECKAEKGEGTLVGVDVGEDSGKTHFKFYDPLS